MSAVLAPAETVLSLHELSVRFGSLIALSPLSFDVSRGEKLAVIGPSGVGKSTMAAALFGLLPPHAIVSGDARLGEVDLLHGKSRKLRRLYGARMAMIPQDAAGWLNPMRRVGAQLTEVICAHRPVDIRIAQAHAEGLLESVGLGRVHLHRYPHELSGGMRQRVVIAMAVAHGPDVIVADEPTSALDVGVQAQVLSMLDWVCGEHNSALVLITHDPAVVRRIADRVVQLEPENGQQPNGKQPKVVPVASLVQQPLSPLRPQVADPKAVLEIANVGRRFGHHHVLDDVTLWVAQGETVALVGESGSGKSTLALLAVGLLRPDTGSVKVSGIDLMSLRRKELRRLRQHMQLVLQDPFAALDPRLSVGHAVAEPLRVHGMGSAKGMGGANIDERVAELLRLVELDPALAQRLPTQLSGGQRQRVALARSLALSPRLLVLDEPVTALDASLRAGQVELLKRLQDELQMGLLFISHDLVTVRALAHRVVVLDHGRVVESGTLQQVWESPLHVQTKALLAT